jgi:diacylglycerol kinase (ATP)
MFKAHNIMTTNIIQNVVGAIQQTAPQIEKTPYRPIKRMRIVLNPVSGVVRDRRDTIEKILRERPDIQYEICETQKAGDAKRYAQEGAKEGFDVVVACGGDGTVMEVADGLRGTETPLGIIPAGTANVMSVELGIPADTGQAVALLLGEQVQTRKVDIAEMDSQTFLLRAGIGYEAEISTTAARADKAKLGRLAYFKAAYQRLRNLRQVRYKLTLDDQLVVVRGITCMICNSTNVGVPGVQIASAASVSDGLLDVIVIQSVKPGSVLRVTASIVQSILPFIKRAPPPLLHWQAKKVTVETSHPQVVAFDGEYFKKAARTTTQIFPAAIPVIVP